MDELVKGLKAIVGNDNVLIDEPMSAHTTFGIGGPARCMVVPHEINEVANVVRACRDAGVELRVIGRGSDLLVADEGLDCVVMRIAENLSDILVTKNRIFAKAGATNEEVAQAALEAGLAGYEFACGIPGTVGGAAIMNAGAYDGEFMDVCEQVICVTPEGEVVPVPRGESQWGYRHSMMDDRGYVVVSAMLALKEGDADAIRARMDDLQRRVDVQAPQRIFRRQAHPGCGSQGICAWRGAGVREALGIRRECRRRDGGRRAGAYRRGAGRGGSRFRRAFGT